MAMKVSVHAGAFGGDVRSAAAAARQMSAEGIVFPIRVGSLDLTSLSTSGARELRHVFSSLDLQLVALERDIGTAGLSPRADLDREIAAIEAALRVAAELGRTMLCVDLGPLPPPPPAPPKPKASADQAGLIILPEPAAPAEPPPPPTPRDEKFEATLNGALAEIGARADRYGVIIAFRATLAPFSSLAQALSSAACPWFGVDLDPLGVLADEEDGDAVLSRIGALIRHVRGRDGIRGAGQRVRPTPLGEGQVDWPQLARDLDSSGYSGFVTIDPRDLSHPTSAAARAVGVLKTFG